MKTIKGNVLCSIAVILAISSVGVVDVIDKVENGWVALAYIFIAVALLGVALVLCVLGINADNEYTEKQSRKIKRVPTHTNEWRDAE